MLWKTDSHLQSYIDVICKEGRLGDLIRECDNYHFETSFGEAYNHWVVAFHIYLNEHFNGVPVWRFPLPKYGAIYFIGPYTEVKQRISTVL